MRVAAILAPASERCFYQPVCSRQSLFVFAATLAASLPVHAAPGAGIQWRTLVVGEDAKKSALLHARLRNEMEGQSLVLRRFDTPGDTQRESKELGRILTAVGEAYYRDDLGDVDVLLDAATALENESRSLLLEQRVLVRLWKAAISQARRKQSDARRHILAALTLDDDLKVNTRVFRPALARLVTEVRRSGLTPVKLSVWPSGAQVYLDGNRVSAEGFAGTAGEHRLRVEAPGFDTLDFQISLPLERVVSVALNDTSTRRALAKRLPSEPVSRDGPVFEGNTCVLAAEVELSTVNFLSICGGSAPVRIAADAAQLATVVKQLSRPQSPEESNGSTDALRLEVALLSGQRSFSAGADREAVNRFFGAGMEAAGDWSFAKYGIFHFSLHGINYSLGEDSVALNNGITDDIGGGYVLRGRAGVGPELRWGKMGRVALVAALLVERVAQADFFENDQQVGRLPSLDVLAAEVSGRFAVGLLDTSTGSLSFDARASVLPIGNVSADPSGALGETLRMGVGGSASASVVWNLRAPVGISLGYRGELRRFSGEGSPSPVFDTTDDLSVRNVEHLFSLGAEVRL
ncbi:MAG: PEGA domain-containing protein [Myxococcota bacterium]